MAQAQAQEHNDNSRIDGGAPRDARGSRHGGGAAGEPPARDHDARAAGCADPRAWHGDSGARRWDDDEVGFIAGIEDDGADSAARGAGYCDGLGNDRRWRSYIQLPAPTYSQFIAIALLTCVPLVIILIVAIGKDDGEPTLERENSRDTNTSLSSKRNQNFEEEVAQPSENPQRASSPAQRTLDLIAAEADYIDNDLFLYETPSMEWLPSTIYNHAGLSKGLEIMNTQGVAGMFYYLGEEGEGETGSRYGLTNVAAFLAQSMKETIKYDACSENSWDNFGGYPLSNSCGQLGQSYQDYHCPKGEEHMECPVDKNMEITATTNAKWYGAPAPLFCRPKKSEDDFTGKWNHGSMCNLGWVDPPKVCDVYEGQKAGGFDNSNPVPNRNGRTDTEGCCWWGRGVIQTTGICNFGKLNYYLGAGAAKEGRTSPYADVDFCKDPEIICSSKKYIELKWIAGMFYWMESVQKYDVRGWNYMKELHKFVDGGFQNWNFLDSVSGIVNRGCHDPPCGTGAVDGGAERKSNFRKALGAFKLIELPTLTGSTGGSQSGSLVLACGTDFQSAAENCTTCAHSQDCPADQFCWNSVPC